MKQELKELFNEIVAVNGKYPDHNLGEENNAFYHKWTKLCLKHDLQTVVKAWADIAEKCASWQYYELLVWKNKLEFHAPDIRDKEPKYSHLKRDQQMAKWAKNVSLYTSGKIKRGDYLKIAKESGQMTAMEIKEELILHDKHNRSLDDYNRGSLMKGVKI